MKNSNHISLTYILVFFGAIMLLGTVFVIWYGVSVSAVPTAMLWMLACFVVGSAVGFLFGIPKIFQTSKPGNGDAASSDYRSQVNTNLTEISDWLTKIIVGLGLVNLTKIPPYITSTARALASGLECQSNCPPLTFAYGLISCFTVLGFLFGYLFTRLVLSRAFFIADQIAGQSVEMTKQAKQIVNDVSSKISFGTGPILEIVKTERVNDSVELKQQKVAELLQRITNYTEITRANTPDYRERVIKKDEALNDLGAFAINNSISKNEIKQLIETVSNSDSLVGVIATQSILKPEPDDVQLLLDIGNRAPNLHIRYRVLLAINNLVNMDYVRIDAIPKVRILVQSYSVGADEPLNRKIDSVLLLLKGG